MTTNTPAKPRRDSEAAAAPRPERTAPYEPAPAEPRLSAPRVRGRHRKPRPRKVLLAAGGLALAAGALSLVRLTSGPGADSVGTVEAEPRPDPVTGTEQATGTSTTVPAVPEVSPSAPTVLGSRTPAPATRGTEGTPAPSVTPDSGTPTTTAPEATAVPGTPDAPAPTATDSTPQPDPAPTPPSRTTPAPAPEPDQPPKPDAPGLCVPVIGLCVDGQDYHR